MYEVNIVNPKINVQRLSWRDYWTREVPVSTVDLVVTQGSWTTNYKQLILLIHELFSTCDIRWRKITRKDRCGFCSDEITRSWTWIILDLSIDTLICITLVVLDHNNSHFITSHFCPPLNSPEFFSSLVPLWWK